jgi:hypothetical protein
VPFSFDQTAIGSVTTDFAGTGTGSFLVPAKPMGQHTVRWSRYGRTATATFTIKPRIKLIPNVNIQRGQTVNVSLRGYAAHETVRIRWKKGSTWVQIATANTSSTGSANINVKVPGFVPNGPTSVRGDGTFGRAQTNAVTVNGGPVSSSAAKATPTPTKTATPTATTIPATATATATTVPAEPTATATEFAPTETATMEPSPTPTPTAEPPTATSSPSDTPVVEQTAIPAATETPAS